MSAPVISSSVRLLASSVRSPAIHHDGAFLPDTRGARQCCGFFTGSM
jgi:hypothetical protein